MPNANTISRIVGAPSPAQGTMVIPDYVPTGTSATVLTNQLGTAAILQVGNSNAQPTGSQGYGSGFDGFMFKVRIAWKVTTGASLNVTVAIGVPGATATTYSSGGVVATTGTQAYNSMSGNGFLEFKGMWDSTGGTVSGYYTGNVGATTPAIIDLTTATNSVAVSTQAGLQFVPIVTCSATTGVKFTVTEFTVEAA